MGLGVREALERARLTKPFRDENWEASLSCSDTTRPEVAGKFIKVNGNKVYLRGVTYGTFRPDEGGIEFPDRDVVAGDFARMVGNGVNTVRTYTVPPAWLLDEAHRNGLYVMVGIPMERYVGYLTDREGAPDLAEEARRSIRAITGHPAVLCYTIGNEIPAATVRWLGRKRTERFLERIFRAVKTEDPGALVTYANYPSTEYLQLDFLDLVCFNVFLDSPDRFAAYLHRLHNIAGERPLIIGEVGFDSLRHGEIAQAENLSSQTRIAFAEGCAGVFLFSWTDDWHTGGGQVEDWEFGLTRRDRSPKPALGAVRGAFAEVPMPNGGARPKVSVIVCTYNGASRIEECLDGIAQLDYPDYETIVVDNGSSDATATIVESRGRVKLVRTPPTGLGHARNVGLEAATGAIVAYIDDDASPDPQWLTYLVHTFAADGYAAVGGPNIAPHNGRPLANVIGRAPGNPVHVLLSDVEAEHIAGCNMAFRADTLRQIGGFDPVYRRAGDDVDIGWRIRAEGHKIGFSHAAMVWHHPRSSIRSFWRQQTGYGQAESLLESKWPEKYNGSGQAKWSGRVYGLTQSSVSRRVGQVYHGTWGTAPFQFLYQPVGHRLPVAAMPEWYAMVLLLATASLLSLLWPLLLFALPLLAIALGVTVTQTIAAARRVRLPPGPFLTRVWARASMVILHLLQPMARTWGRVRGGLTPWARPSSVGPSLPWLWIDSHWSESWKAPPDRLARVEHALLQRSVRVRRGGAFDHFDLEVRGGMLGSARLLQAVEEHGAGRQLIRTRVWPRPARLWWGAGAVGTATAIGLSLLGVFGAAAMSALFVAVVGSTGLWECGIAKTALHRAVDESQDGDTSSGTED